LYELIAGKPLFRRENDEETLRAVREAPLPSLEDFGVSETVTAVLRKALARVREDRYVDARAFELALQGALHVAGGMSAHQLALRMRELFPAESSAAPTANQGDQEARSSSSGDSSNRSLRSFPQRSNTFEPRLTGREDTATKDLPSEERTPALAKPRMTAEALAQIDATSTPPLGVQKAATLSPGSPTSTSSPKVQEAKPVSAPSPPWGRTILLALLLIAVVALIWIVLRGGG
jgi:cobalamin biosynthesis Mg chelatase CobN